MAVIDSLQLRSMAKEDGHALCAAWAARDRDDDVPSGYELGLQASVAGAGDGNCLGHMMLQREELMRQRRLNMDKHHHKQIWSKHPHGGAYYKVRKPGTDVPASSCNDILNSIPASTPAWVTLGYEEVKVGSTTNIVGDAMSNAAVELAKAELASKQLPGDGIDLHWAKRNNSTCQLPVLGGELQHHEPAENDCEGQAQRFRRLWAKLESQGKTPQMLFPANSHELS